MPELPDLQVFSHNLTKLFKNKKLAKITLTGKANVPEKKLQEILDGLELKKVVRVGKQLHFEFEKGHVLGMHLMLHGQLYAFDNKNEQKFTAAELLFEGGKGLALTDFQKAANLTLDPEPSDVPDALDADVDYLTKKLSATRTAVKTVLMDQHILRGIGNAYADEILYDAKLSPFSASNKIPTEKVKQLVHSIDKVLKHAEEKTLKDHPDIISGEFRDFLQVHQPKKKTTPAGETIHQKPVGSRKTYYTDAQELFE
jgi:formamidopyrimidine-DNA glycosylase